VRARKPIRSSSPTEPAFFQRDMRQLVFTWSIKCRISEQAEAVRFDECSGTADQTDTGALMITPADAAPRTGAATSDPRPKTEQHGRLLEP
jgi:hypothetical protein